MLTHFDGKELKYPGLKLPVIIGEGKAVVEDLINFLKV